MDLTDGVIVLRPPTLDDAEGVAAAVLASLEHLSPFMPWATAGYTVESARAWIKGELDPGSHPFLIIDPGGRIVGSAGVNRIDSVNNRADIGYWLHDDATGKGYATRASKLLLRYAFDELGLHRVEIFMDVANEPSRKVAERTGATYEGVLHGRLKYPDRYSDAHMFAVISPHDR